MSRMNSNAEDSIAEHARWRTVRPNWSLALMSTLIDIEVGVHEDGFIQERALALPLPLVLSWPPPEGLPTVYFV